MQKKFQIIIFFILFLAAFLRFYNFPDRWGIGDDSSRDIAIAREALDRHELPLIGSFSSAGPFVFGPIFYWTIMASYLMLPFIFTAPIITTILSGIATVAILIACGYLISGRRLAIITGILTATSIQLTVRSVILGQHTYVAFTTALLFLSFILYWQRKKIIYAFLMGISLGAAIGFHYQAINLLIFLPAVLCIPRGDMGIRKRLIALFIMSLGFLIPSIPLIIWDSQQQWANTRNILDYLLIAQNRLYVPNSWRLFLFQYLPSYWSFVVSGYAPVALFLMFFTGITTAIFIIKRKIPSIMIVFSIIFASLLLINRFYKGERSEGYLIYLAPFIIIFTAWSINKLFDIHGKKIFQKLAGIIGAIILIIIIGGNIWQLIKYEQTTNMKLILNKTVILLIKKYPNTKFTIYDYHNRSGSMSQPLSLWLKMHDRTDPRGMPIGFVCWSKECPQNLPKITTLGYNTIVQMQNIKDRDVKSSGWVNVNQESMYDDLIGWSKKNELKSTFSITNYILERLPKI
ncbi:glycosyltransferase family 39 protein [Patescibacteria group bacterium]|nr:glycosyltransferase family 39 protein [Patescibacteria group bacterium]MBU4016280.1 glycosyltransferase family 39 protein [Patescibacteria group bacterium]MBU4099061.1 glycosyltransferase family 39 protein [Patescibacteria group bacterium]